MEEPKYCIIQFKYNCKTNLGEEVHISGNIPELGNWDINKSEKMVTNRDDYPLWKSKESIKVLQNCEIEYKYLIKTNDKFIRWIPTPSNKNLCFKVQNMLRVVILDPGSKIEKYTPGFQQQQTLQQSPHGTPSIDDYFDLDNCAINANDINDEDNCENEYSPPLKLRKYTRDDLHLSVKEKDDDILPLLNCSITDNDSASSDTDEQSISLKDVEIEKDDEVIICTFYLPLCAGYNSVNDEWVLQVTNEPIYHTLYYICKGNKRIKWIGLLKNAQKIAKECDRERLYTLLETKHNMYALKIKEEMYDSLLVLFNELFQPRFHYFSINPQFIWKFSQTEEYWDYFRDFSDMVANKISKLIKEKGYIFLNDYHFFFVPSLLYSDCTNFKQKTVQKISIGLFMHSPFPSIDVFKTFAFREEILKSMLNCSVIGFHTFDSSRNFLRTVKQLLGIDFESTIKGDLALSYFGRKLVIRVSNITPETSMINEMYNSTEFKAFYDPLKQKHNGKYIFVSLDNIQFISITKQKLEGYRRFLRDINDNSSKVVFIQYIKYSSDELSALGEILQSKDQKELLEQITSLAQSINKEFGMEVIELKVQPITYTERLAALAVGNCFIRTSKRESFSLGIYEFLILKSLTNDTNDIEYMISEFSGVNKTLENTIKINPFDCNSIYQGFLLASTPFFDKKGLNSKQRDFLIAKKSSAHKWFMSFWKDIKNHELHEEDTYYIGTGHGLNFRLMKTQANFVELSKKKITADYENSSKRFIFFNYEEEYMNKNNNESLKKIYQFLDLLAEDQHNSIYILSDKTQKKLTPFINHYPNLTFVSEKGYSYKEPSQLEWKRLSGNDHSEWIDIAKKIIAPYTKRCEGSYIQTKEATVTWNYKDSDNILGKMFAKTIIDELEYSFKCDELAIVKGPTSIEISNKDINKGRFASHVLKDVIHTGKGPDFILAIGNSCSDEKLFSYLMKKGNCIKSYARKSNIYTVLIGKRPTNAETYIQSLVDMRNIFEKLGRSLTNQSISKSTFNVNKYTSEGSFDSNYLSTKSGDFGKSFGNNDE